MPRRRELPVRGESSPTIRCSCTIMAISRLFFCRRAVIEAVRQFGGRVRI